MITHLVTHSGSFHADETFATALLAELFPEARLVRTRDAALIERLAPAAITYDVGGAFDPETRRFDHHQAGSPRREPEAGALEGTPYSGFGLIWRAYGRDWLRSRGVEAVLVEAVHALLDRKIVLPIDLLDNGVIAPMSLGIAAELSLPATIEAMNPGFDAASPDAASLAEDVAFADAVAFAGTALRAQAAAAAAAVRAEAVIDAVLEAQPGAAILELPAGLPIESLSLHPKAGAALFVVRPRRSDWVIAGIAREPGSFTLRRDLPDEWAGLEGAALEATSGVEGAIFCHKGRFMAVAADRKSALALAARALG